MVSEQQLEVKNSESNRAIFEHVSTNQTWEITESKLKEIITLAIDERLSDKLAKLENSLNLAIERLESVSNQNSNSDNKDIILSKINLSKEEYYPYTCSTLADVLKVRSYDLAKIIKTLGLREDSKYHLCIATGRTGKVHKYSEAALQKLREKLSSQQSV
jgi:hypothetical protein